MDATVRELHFAACGAAPAAVAAQAGRATSAPGDNDDGGSSGDDTRFRFAVDFDAAERWPDVAYDTAAPAARPDAAMRARIVAVLDAAGQTMARRVPAAFRLVDSQMQRVLLRCSPGSPGTSTSHRAHVGACLLTNLHQPAEAVAVAIEALTHESIHQLLYRTEAATGHFCDLAEAPTFRSPWSGARLPLHSLIHACFVWFGLLTLWSELASHPATAHEAAHARGRIAHCLFGFAFLDDLLDSPGFPVASVDPQVLDAIRGLAAATLHATRAAEPLTTTTLRLVASSRHGAGWPAALAGDMAALHAAG